MRARKVVTRSGRKIRGYFPSLKMGRMVEWESLLERDAILLLEFSPGVSSFREQPELIQYRDGDAVRRYFPDFEITTTSGEYIHLEVKPEGQLLRPDVASKLGKVAGHYAARKQAYRILTDKVIRQQPVHGNVTLLARMCRHDETLISLSSEVHLSLAKRPLPFDEVAHQIGRDRLLKMIALGHVGCDLTAPLSGANPVCHPREIDHDQVLF